MSLYDEMSSDKIDKADTNEMSLYPPVNTDGRHDAYGSPDPEGVEEFKTKIEILEIAYQKTCARWRETVKDDSDTSLECSEHAHDAACHVFEQLGTARRELAEKENDIKFWEDKKDGGN